MLAPPYYLIGSAGYPNFGDELIAASWLRHLAEVAPAVDVWLDCPQPGMAQNLFEGLHPRLRTTNTLWRAVGDAAHLPVEEVGPRVAALIHGLGSPHYDLGLLRLRSVRSMHLIGGGYVNGVWPHHAGLVEGMKAVKQLTGAPLYATGQGLMPAAVDAARELFADFDHVTVRDDASAQAHHLPLGLDDAFLGAQAEIARRPAPPAGLYVCIQSDMADEGRFDEVVTAARPLVEHAARQGKAVHYVEAIPGVDRLAYDRLADLIPDEHFVPFSDVWTRGLPVSPEQEWITTRFHLHLLASAAGARGVAVPIRHGYYDVKHHSLRRLGSGWGVADGPGPLQVPQGTGSLAEVLPGLAARKRAEADLLYPLARTPEVLRV
ncbi:polysaccharide pyruvyl transferase family protein [Rhodococcus sp. X156]|uniref:polysaccharide pyruvyl transferase family protein n=1 Tax=Rhodococcus sp. X156 TaxID=2499145 RepID=UPI0013E2990F|nr:polysaccharide pyruvyl transferase family protein [Rhodococcus sp. X156]